MSWDVPSGDVLGYDSIKIQVCTSLYWKGQVRIWKRIHEYIDILGYTRISVDIKEDIGVINLSEPSPTPCLYVAPAKICWAESPLSSYFWK